MVVKGVDKAVLFMALYNRAQTQGMGVLHYSPKQMDLDEARKIIASCGTNLHFDYCRGRVMKIDLTPDFLDTRLYNRDNGHEAAEDAILEELTKPVAEPKK